MKKFKNSKGITLIALVITIIVLLILAGVTIATLTGDNVILTQANDSKEKTEISKEKEMINLAITSTIGIDGHKNLTVENLQEELDKLEGKGNVEVSDVIENFEVYFTKSKIYYEIDKDGNVGDYQIAGDINYAGDITKGGTLDGSEQKPYEINCIEDLVAFSNIINKTGMTIENGVATEVSSKDYNNVASSYVILKRNLNFNSKFSYENSARTDFGDINEDDTDGNELLTEMTTGTGFRPIGQLKYGTFNGQGYEISNIYINHENEVPEDGYGIGSHVGLFGFGNKNSTIIRNVIVSGIIKGKGHAGGIIGERAKLIENCVNRADITGYNMVGGIAGYACTEITRCINYGKINITGNAYWYGGAGGIAGNSVGIIYKCINYGKVDGNHTLGGVCGCNGGEIIKNSYNKGRISSDTINVKSGGIIGHSYSENIDIINCYNEGEVKGLSSKGGIIGECAGMSWDANININIINSYNKGDIISINNDSSGGIIGVQGTICAKNYVTLKNVYNVGEISGGKKGNIIGSISRSENTDTKTNFENVYCLDNLSAVGNGTIDSGEAIQKSESNMKAKEFVDLLNTNIGENTEWSRWRFITNEYPSFE